MMRDANVGPGFSRRVVQPQQTAAVELRACRTMSIVIAF